MNGTGPDRIIRKDLCWENGWIIGAGGEMEQAKREKDDLVRWRDTIG